MTQEVVKSMFSKLGTMLEFDKVAIDSVEELIAINSVEELKSRYDAFVKENFTEAQTETTILKD